MPNYVWKGRNRTGLVQEGVLVADTKEVALATLRRQNIVVTGIRERGKEISLTKMGRRSRQDPRGLHAPVLGHDRRGTAARAVPRDPRQPAGAQDLRQDPAPGPPGRRGGLDAGRRHAPAPQGLRRPLRQHGRRGRGGRYPRHDPPAPLDLHREGGQAALAGPRRADLPDRGHHHRRDRRRGHPAEGHPDLRRPVHEPRGRAALPDARRHRGLELPRALLHLLRHRARLRHLLLPPLLPDLPRPPRRRRHDAQGADHRHDPAQDRRRAVLPDARDPDLLGRADPREPRHHGAHGGQRHRGRRHPRDAQERREAARRSSSPSRTRRSSRTWSSR